ncbi:hypothetical protein FRX31_009489 [Thalictrum thalictroides]|uniref:RNase H type-1 domain-containing protein n=1 Tax=Thalictrum thalictroides TaxID=46969 RepID=A0A7J6WWL7_THATH|nr:hypothetical protein FRX31_009489 [Thalictrum thalictroides]
MENIICTITPMLIMWEIWKERNSRLYDDSYTWSPNSSAIIIGKVRFWIIIFNKAYSAKVRSSLKFEQTIKGFGILLKNPPLKPPIIVYWTRPPEGFVALNTDGAANNEEAAGGGIIRDLEGNHLSNFFSYYGKGSNNYAESRAILDGIALCVKQGFNKVLLQTDSKLALQWSKQEISIPWNLRAWWRHYRHLTEQMTILYMHTFKEANSVADHLAKKGMDYKCMGACNRWVDKDLGAKISSDKSSIPYLRHILQ